jgi:MarR family transcriptional regulator, organic hydroperoxide resistance regulator
MTNEVIVVQPIEEIRYLILAVQREGSRMLAEALRPLELTPSQAEVLRILQDHQPLSLVAVGELLVCEIGSPSRLVNGLVQAGLVERLPSPTDGRMVTIALTEKGQEMATQVQDVEGAMYQFMAGALEGVSLPEIQALLWRFVEGRPSGEALARRAGKSPLNS